MNKPLDDSYHNKVSLVIPMFNAETTIEQCILSIKRQTYSNLQIIIVDDNSTDHSLAKLSNLVKDDQRFQIIKQSLNQGASVARNVGIDNAKGQYLFFLDADDWIEPGAIELLVNLAIQSGCDFVCANHIQDVNGKFRKKQAVDFTEDIVFDDNKLLTYIKQYLHLPYQYTLFVHCWGKLFDLNLIREKGLGFNEELVQFEDVNFNHRYLSCCSKVAYKHAYIYHHSISTTSQSLGSTMGTEDRYVEKVLVAYSSIEEFIQSHDIQGVINVEKELGHLVMTTLIITIIRLCKSVKTRALRDIYMNISKIVMSPYTHQRLPFYSPGEEDSLLIFFALKTKKVFWVILAGFMRIGFLFLVKQISTLKNGVI